MKHSLLKSAALTGLSALTLFAAAPLQAEDEKIVESNFDFNFSPDGQNMIYYAYKGKTLPDIFRHQDGKEVNLTKSSETWDIEPDYSPDGSMIAYSSGDSMAVMDLKIMAADGSHGQILVDLDDSIIGPAWAPDGQSIAFSTFVMGAEKPSGDIYVTSKDGTNLRNLTENIEGGAMKPSWSPDGQHIYFTLGKVEKGPSDIYRMNADGSHLKRVTDFSSADLQVFDVNVTPGGDSLVFTGTDKDGGTEIYVISANSSTIVTKPQQVTDTKDAQEYFLSFTPNGHHLTYSKGDWETGFAFAHLPTPKFGQR